MIPFFSVIIPLYNKEQYITATLKSVLNQSYQNFELIIINDGSTDNSLNVAKFALKNIKKAHFFTQTNKGLSAARNIGVSKAKGTVIAFLDADDLWKSNYLKTLFLLYNQFPECSVYGTDYIEKINTNAYLTTTKNISTRLKGSHFIISDFFKANMFQNIITPSSFAIKTVLFKKIKFNERITYAEDIDFYIKCFASQKLAYSYTSPVILLKNIPNQITQNGILNRVIVNIDSYEALAKNKPSLKQFLNVKRYHYASQYKLANAIDDKNKLIKHINYKHLTLKQKLLLKSPLWIHKILVTIKRKLLQNSVKVTSY